MADTVDVTDGQYTATVASDDAGAAGHVQIVKLAIATDGSATAIPADANGLKVQAGTNLDTSALLTSANFAAAFGTAGTADTQVMSVQGIASMTPVQVSQATAGNLNMTEASAAAIKTAVELIDDTVYTDDTSTHSTGTSKGVLVMGVADPTDAAVSANDIGALSMTTSREVRVATGLNYSAASAAQTQTNLDGLASSSTHLAGWESTAIDNSTTRYRDFIINAVLRTEGSAVTAGECRMYLVAELEDASWPDVFDGTESAETVTDTEERDAICRLAAVSANDTSTAANVYLMCPSVAAVFNGTVPRKFVIFITQNTGTTLETTGDPNVVYVRGVY